MSVVTNIAPARSEGAILAKAGFRAAQALGLSQKGLGEVIVVSAASA